MLDTYEAFKRNYLVCGLPEPAIAEVWAISEQETHLARETLIRINDKSSDLFVILDGQVQVLTGDGDVLAEPGPGSVLGEMSLIDDRPRSAEIVCISLTKVARVPANELRSYMNNNREVGFVILANLARVLSGRLRIADAKIDTILDGGDPWRNSL
jgi:CRP-like cAMP-binding protein